MQLFLVLLRIYIIYLIITFISFLFNFYLNIFREILM